jgi:hypothetical protein
MELVVKFKRLVGLFRQFIDDSGRMGLFLSIKKASSIIG